MDSNYLQNLFINEVKGALNSGGGGGSGGNVKIPTKLSELENDLFYSKRTEFLTLTKADFVPWVDPNGDTQYLYISSPKLDWLQKTDDIAWELSFIYEGNPLVLDSNNTPVFVDHYITDDGMGCIAYYGDMPFEIRSGADIKNYDGLVTKDEFVITLLDYEVVDEFNLKIYKVDSKKVPIEYCDTTEIENAIDTLTEEVWNQ